MICPVCQHAESRVLRTDAERSVIRRRRECARCRHRWTSFEVLESEHKLIERAKQARELLA